MTSATPNLGPSRRSTAPLIAVLLVLVSIALAVLSLATPDAWFAAVGVAAITIVATPWLLQPRLDWFGPWALVMLSVFLGSTCTGICVSLRWPNADHVDDWFRMGRPPEDFFLPCLVFLLGLATLACGYYWPGPTRKQTLPEESRSGSGLSDRRVYPLVAVLLLISLWASAEWVKNTGGLGGALSSKRTLVMDMQKDYNQHGPLLELARFAQFAFYVLLGHVLHRRRSPTLIDAMLLFVSFGIGAAVPFIASRRLGIMLLFLATLVILQTSPRRLSKLQVVGFVLLTLVAFQFMSLIRGKEEISGEVAEKLGLERFVQSVVLNRNLADLTKTSHIIHGVHDTLPEKLGETFYIWLITPIPRSIWPEKPLVQRYCLEVGSDIYGEKVSSVPPGLVAEAYWNFRVPGVVVACFVFGFFLRYMSDTYGMGSTAALPAILVHVVGPMRMGFDALSHSLGFGVFAPGLQMAVMLAIVYVIRERRVRRPSRRLEPYGLATNASRTERMRTPSIA